MGLATSKTSTVAILLHKNLNFEVAKYKVTIYELTEVRQGVAKARLLAAKPIVVQPNVDCTTKR